MALPLDCHLVIVVRTAMILLKAILNDGTVAMEFMTDDSSEAEEMRKQMLAFDCVTEVVALDESG
ncbi:MAG: hypothetical protein JO170_29980 [Verrucomicrobia bacterium]|nr:hypothetical protein [Verrucomicrobiota bacterium]